MVDAEQRYNAYSSYLQRRYGERVYRIAVDAGFSCPHREADRSSGGCSFCGAGGSRAPYLGEEAPCGPPGSPQALRSLSLQIRAAREFLGRRYGARAFILFFQAFSGTYASLDALRATYEAGLAEGPFHALAVATRPDCLDPARADLLASYRTSDREVWVELGLQSASDRTLRRVRRGHGVDDFVRAARLLAERGVRVAVHLIFGLPGEGWQEVEATVSLVSWLACDGVKIHNLHVLHDTPLAREVQAGELPVLSPERHLEYVIGALERLPPETLVMRLTCDTPRGALALPRRFWDKERFRRRLLEEMEARDTWQGRLLGAPRPEQRSSPAAVPA